MGTKHFLSLWIRHLLNILNVNVAAQLWHQDGYSDNWIFVLSQVVTAHAVRVAVTNNLSANITGFLPIHCIYQLLRSRAFTKHKVSIKVTLRIFLWLCCVCSVGILSCCVVFFFSSATFIALCCVPNYFLHFLLLHYSIQICSFCFCAVLWKRTSRDGTEWFKGHLYLEAE